MKTMPFDPILTEMHAIKDAISAECDHDVDKLFDRLGALERNTDAIGKSSGQNPARKVKKHRRKAGLPRRSLGVKISG